MRVVIITACVFGVVACSAGSHTGLSLDVKSEPVILVPDIEAGKVGWCVAEADGASCPQGPARQPIVAESWGSSSSPPVIEGYAVMSKQTAFVSIDGEPLVRTRAEPTLPDGLRTVAVKLTGTALGKGIARVKPHFVPFNARGEQLSERLTREAPLWSELPTQTVRNSRRPAGACSLRTMNIRGLEIGEAKVVTRVATYRGLVGLGFMSCASTFYKLKGSPMVAAILLSASHPGSIAPDLPAMKLVLGSSDIFLARGFEGEMLARRIGGGWLVVSQGDELRRRTLLNDLRATVRID
jgi:hypothetical protein